MLAMILVVLGLIAFSQLGLDFFPDLEFPTASVITVYRGASSEDIENTITRPLEQIINSVSRVKKVNSVTVEGASVIMVEFEWGTNLDFAAQDIRDQLGLYRSYLPEEAADPLVVKFNISQFPILFGGITADRPTLELKEIIEDEVAPRLERIDGVASVQVYSTEVREILVNVDKAALESLKLSLDQILLALRMENVNLPAGHVVERYSEFLIRTLGEFDSVDDIRKTIVGTTQTGQPVYLSDVADVRDALKETRFESRIQRERGLIYIISKRSGANTVITAEAVKKELARIQQTLPPDVEFWPFVDQADMIQQVIRKTGNNALIGGILAVFFLFVFLRNWRPTLTIALAIPLSVITTFIALYLAGYTLNLLTLGGLALGIGMLVDNAIVVIENIFRRMEEGEKRSEAAKRGASEVGMAITASTLTTIAVFFPMVFARGITGKLTQGLALSVAFALLASLFVALTIVPMAASLLFKANQNQNAEGKSEKKVQFGKARNFYRSILEKTMKHRAWVLAGVLGLFVLSFALVPFLGTEFMPSSDRDMLILKVKMPVGTSLEETDRIANLVEGVMAQEPEIKTISAQIGSAAEEDPSDLAGGFANAGTHEGILWVGLIPQTEREASDQEVLERIRRKLPQLKGVKFEALDMSQMMMGGSQAAVEIKVFGKDIYQLKNIADNIVSRIEDVEGLRDITHTFTEGKPEYQIRIDREKASRMGLMVSQIASTVQTASLGRIATRYREGNEEIDIRVRFKEQSRDSLAAVENIPIMTPLNQMIR